MSTFKKGQRVHVEFDGVISQVIGETAWVLPGGNSPGLRARGIQVSAITLADPADWPPQVGDIWEADGREYYVRGRAVCTGLIIEPFNTDDPGPKWQYTDELLDEYKALNPVLVRRRGQ
jgi:hypothetical protein